MGFVLQRTTEVKREAELSHVEIKDKMLLVEH
jgi:hypothetical protein